MVNFVGLATIFGTLVELNVIQYNSSNLNDAFRKVILF